MNSRQHLRYMRAERRSLLLLAIAHIGDARCEPVPAERKRLLEFALSYRNAASELLSQIANLRLLIKKQRIESLSRELMASLEQLPRPTPRLRLVHGGLR